MTVTLRPVTPEDEEFLLQIYASARAEELARVPWSDSQREAFLRMQLAAQHSHYRQRNPTATYDLIVLNNEAIGRLYVARREQEIRILDITLMHTHRNRGIGTSLIKGLMEEAARAEKPLNIYVEFYNPSYRLFERLGFMKVDRLDDDGVNHLMEWRTIRAVCK